MFITDFTGFLTCSVDKLSALNTFTTPLLAPTARNLEEADRDWVTVPSKFENRSTHFHDLVSNLGKRNYQIRMTSEKGMKKDILLVYIAITPRRINRRTVRRKYQRAHGTI